MQQEHLEDPVMIRTTSRIIISQLQQTQYLFLKLWTISSTLRCSSNNVGYEFSKEGSFTEPSLRALHAVFQGICYAQIQQNKIYFSSYRYECTTNVTFILRTRQWWSAYRPTSPHSPSPFRSSRVQPEILAPPNTRWRCRTNSEASK